MLCFLFAVSGVFVWSSFIEPNSLRASYLDWSLKDSQSHLDGLKIVFISDLHLRKSVPGSFLKKIIKKINNHSPDILLFGGDFICRSFLDDPLRLQEFFSAFSPKYGSFGVLGNHDYEEYVSRMENNEFNVVNNHKGRFIKRIFSSLRHSFSKKCPDTTFNPYVKTIPQNQLLIDSLKNTPLRILHNETFTLPIGLNIVGLGEHMLQRVYPEQAFRHYDTNLPGIILLHNPDSIHRLKPYPGDWILSGHTHGQQIKIPGLNYFEKFSAHLTGVKDPKLLRGLSYMYEPLSQKIDKRIYVTCGLGSGGNRIRFNAVPEITFITCKKARHVGI